MSSLSQDFKALDIYLSIEADIAHYALRTGIDDITNSDVT